MRVLVLLILVINLFLCMNVACASESSSSELPLTSESLSAEITPYKWTKSSELVSLTYKIPPSVRFTVPCAEKNAPDIVYYVSRPKERESYPIAIMCGGRQDTDTVHSRIFFHRYFLQEFFDVGCGLVTAEQWGVDGKNINKEEFLAHCICFQRISDHKIIIERLKSNPPVGWNGKLVLFGFSEGGYLVTALTELYSDITIATINWCGAGDCTWRELLWGAVLLSKKQKNEIVSAQDQTDFELKMNEILANPLANKSFMGSSYLWHANWLNHPASDYKKLKVPFLVVMGTEDSMIIQCDQFVSKAKAIGVDITYIRVDGMGHYIPGRADIVQQSFEWLKGQLNKQLNNKH